MKKAYKIHKVQPGAVVTDESGSMFLVTNNRYQDAVTTVQLSGGKQAYQLRWLPLDTMVSVHRPHLTGL